MFCRNPDALYRVHPGSGLVQKQDLGVGGQSDSHLQNALVSMREGAGRRCGAFEEPNNPSPTHRPDSDSTVW